MSGRWICLLSMLLITQLTFAAIDTYEFENDIQRKRYQSFIDEMRCPKCQNQNLSGSDSPIAADLRRELHTMIVDGRSDKEIVDFMVARYGEFILYRPRLNASTILLWVGPALLLVLGIIVLILIVIQRRKAALSNAETSALNADEQARLTQLLGRSESSTQPHEPETLTEKENRS